VRLHHPLTPLAPECAQTPGLPLFQSVTGTFFFYFFLLSIFSYPTLGRSTCAAILSSVTSTFVVRFEAYSPFFLGMTSFRHVPPAKTFIFPCSSLFWDNFPLIRFRKRITGYSTGHSSLLPFKVLHSPSTTKARFGLVVAPPLPFVFFPFFSPHLVQDFTFSSNMSPPPSMAARNLLEGQLSPFLLSWGDRFTPYLPPPSDVKFLLC